LYAGLVKMLSTGEQAVGLIAKVIARLEKERAEAADEALLRQIEAEAAERRRHEEERKRQEEEEEKRRKEAALATMKGWFVFKRVLVILIAVAYFLIGVTISIGSHGGDEDQQVLFWGYLASIWIICVFPYPDAGIAGFATLGLAVIFGLGELSDRIHDLGARDYHFSEGHFHFFLPIGVVILSFVLLSGRKERWEEKHEG
jgi:hypothetical protein